MKLTYFHNDNLYPGRYTIAVDVSPLSGEELVKSYLSQNPITIKVGVAHVHPKDRFIKATGREVAKKYLKEVEMNIVGLEGDSNRLVIITKTNNLKLVFTHYLNSGIIRFILGVVNGR